MEHDCYELRCKDTGIQCDYVAKARTMDELMADASKHTAEVHGIAKYTDEKMESFAALIRHNQEC
jgi:predicted small metal-binding protein